MPRTHTARRLRVGRLAILVVGTLLLAGGGVLLHQWQVRRQAGALLDRADAAAEKQDWPAATRLYQSYLNFRPQDVPAVAKYVDALEASSAPALRSAAKGPAARRQLVLVYERLLRLDDSLAAQRKTLAGHYQAIGLYPACRSHARALLATPEFAGDPDLHVLLAECDEKERQFPPAVANYKAAIATGKAKVETYSRLAFLLHNQIGTKEARDEATAVMQAMIDEKNTDVERRLARARFRFQTGKTGEARQDVEDAYRDSPGGATNTDVVLALAEFAAAEGKGALPRAKAAITGAITAKEKAADQDPTARADVARLRVALADVQIALEEQAEAAKTLSDAATKLAGKDLVLADVAERQIDLRAYTDAATTVARLAGDDRPKPVTEYLTGRLKLAEGNWPAALGHFTAAAAAEDQLGRARRVKTQLAFADCYRLANNPDKQLAAALRAKELDGTSLAAGLAVAESLAGVGRRAEAITEYAGLRGRANPDRAQIALCQLTLADLLDRPEAERNYAVLEERLGPPPLQLELAVIKVNALAAQNKLQDAVAMLEAAAKASPDKPELWALLAVTLGGRGNTADALAALDKAERGGVVDRAELRLVRAQLLARNVNPDVAAIRAAGENAAGFSPADRYRLATGLGGLFVALGRPADAAEQYRRAAAEMPFDLPARLARFDLAVAAKDDAVQADVLKQLEAIEGPTGPTRLVAEASRDLVTVPRGDAAAVAAVRAKAEQARAQRASWGRVHALLGDVDVLDGRGDGAVAHYRRAFELGERNPAVARNYVALLLDRGGHAEAYAALGRLARAVALPADLEAQFVRLRAAFGEDRARALEWARSPRAKESKSHADHLIRAEVLAANNATKDARLALETAAGLKPESAEVWVALVRLLAVGGSPAEAKAAAAQAAAKAKPAGDAPHDKAALAVALGLCHELVNDPAKAETYYRDATAADPASVAALDRLAGLLYRVGRRADADALLAGVARTSPAADVRRWARRARALAIAGQPDGYAQLPAALALLDENLGEANLLDDQRAKALVLATDPFRADEAVKLLTTSTNPPLTPDQGALLARLRAQAGRYDLAEVALRDATRATHLTPPEYLAQLARVQLKRDNPAAARATVTRLQAAAPGSWLATAEHCRVLAAEGKTAEAVGLLTAMVPTASPDDLVNRVGPMLEELKATADARKAYDRAMAGAASNTGHVALAQFLVRTGAPQDAVRLAFEFAETAPPGATARLLAAAARSRPPALTPEPERKSWEDALRRADEWVAAKHRDNPIDTELTFARAELHDVFQRFDEALDTYAAGLKIKPDHPVLLNNHAVLLALHKRGQWAAALEEIERVVRAAGPRAALLDSRAVILLAGDKVAEAERDLRAAVALDRRPVYLFHRAQVLDRLGPSADAAALRDEAVAQARAAGLTKVQLHPKEWGEYDRLMGTKGK